MLTISNQPSFNGKLNFALDVTRKQKYEFAKVADKLKITEKPYDLFISSESVVAQKAADVNNPIGPKYEGIIDQKRNNIAFTVKSVMKNFEHIMSNQKA